MNRLLLFFLLTLTGTGMLSSCLKEEESVGQISAVRALNAVPGSGQLDIGLDQNQLNYDRQAMRAENFAYGDTLPYKNAWPGSRWVRVFETGTGARREPIAQGSVQFRPGSFYSLYVVGYDENVEVLITEDDLSAPGRGKSKVRFIHLSPDAPALDVFVADTEEPLVADLAFKEAKGFLEVSSDRTYAVRITDHRRGDVLYTFTFSPDPNRIYTIWLKGLLDSPDDEALAFGQGTILH